MSKFEAVEWAGAGTVATAAGMFDVRLGVLLVGLWLIWFAWSSDAEDSGDDDGDDV